MTKSELIESLYKKLKHLSREDAEIAVKTIINEMIQTLGSGKRIEIRGFGSFSLRHRIPRIGRNPKTGALVELPAKFVPHFKHGKELRERVNNNWLKQQ